VSRAWSGGAVAAGPRDTDEPATWQRSSRHARRRHPRRRRSCRRPPELALLAQFSACGGLVGAGIALYRDRRHGPDGDRRSRIVTAWTIVATLFASFAAPVAFGWREEPNHDGTRAQR